VSARAEPRSTRDVDLAVSVLDDEAAESVIHALVTRGYRLKSVVEQTRQARLATARLVLPRVAMKLLARDDRRRPQDADDLRVLLPLAKATERRRVERAISLIEERGYARGRDLAARWRTLRGP
jgi:hypothetical protein